MITLLIVIGIIVTYVWAVDTLHKIRDDQAETLSRLERMESALNARSMPRSP